MNTSPQHVSRISAWSLIRPYWVSEERWIAWGLLTLIIAMNMAIVFINVRINAWNQVFYNALQARDAKTFSSSLVTFSVFAFSFILLAVYSRYFRQMLEFRWRQWLTHRYLEQWLGDKAFYRIERDHLADNPDQRVADDLQTLSSITLALSLDLLSTVVTLVSFITILWTTAGSLSIVLSGHALTIPGYMVWAAALYAIAGSIVMQKFGGPLVSVNYQQQRVEADFRFSLIRLRENAEQIALYDGARAESQSANIVFERIRDNWRLVMKFTKRLTFVNSIYGQIAIIFPFFVAAPRYLAGAYTFGVLMRINDAFAMVSGCFSWFMSSYGTLASWYATVNRLREFQRVMQGSQLMETVSPATEHGGINRRLMDSSTLATRGLTLALPDGRVLAEIGSVEIAPGERWLVRGRSGSGKSTLMRALAGLWPFGAGSIDVPLNAKIMFLPQTSYMPIGALRAALCYPSPPDAFNTDACRLALTACGLPDYLDRLDESAHWARSMSPGEQQRLAFARLLLQRPDYVFLDEATNALDPEMENRLYRLLEERLPRLAVMSVAHGETLTQFHDRLLDMEPPRPAA